MPDLAFDLETPAINDSFKLFHLVEADGFLAMHLVVDKKAESF